MDKQTRTRTALILILLALLLTACNPSPKSATSTIPQHVTDTLRSLTKVDAYPVYIMHFVGSYGIPEELAMGTASVLEPQLPGSWACSLFAASGDPDCSLFGRNFDWEHSPMLLLHTNPEEGYAAVTCIDFAYLIEDEDVWHNLEDQPLDSLYALLEAPYFPFNGMNEHGLAIGMAAVAPDMYVSDPEKETAGSLDIMRLVLECARTADEAIELIRGVSITNQGGPHLHYLIADRHGNSALIEYVEGELIVHQNHEAWHVATNFAVALVDGAPIGQCPRYDLITRMLEDASGVLSANQAMDILQQVGQSGTQWSIVYDLSNLTIHMALGRNFNTIHTFEFSESEVTLQ